MSSIYKLSNIRSQSYKSCNFLKLEKVHLGWDVNFKGIF